MTDHATVAFAVLLSFSLLGCAAESPRPDDGRQTSENEEIPLPDSGSRCVSDWTRSGSVDVRTIGCDSGGGIRLVRVDAASLDAVVTSPATASSIGREHDLAVAINANFFDPENRPLGIVRTRAGDRGARHNVSWQSIFSVDRDGAARIVLAEEWDSVADEAVVAVQAGPRLVSGGKIVKVNPDEASARSGVCLEGSSVILFATAPGYRLTAPEIAQLAHASGDEGLGCDDAMLFDGGGSTQLYIRDLAELSDDADVVPVFVVAR